jgi:hypothetical protein
MVWDWSRPGQKNAMGKPFKKDCPLASPVDSKKGDSCGKKTWYPIPLFNGAMSHKLITDVIDPRTWWP